LAWVLGRVLAEVRAGATEYRSWWSREDGPDTDSTPPWSDQDEETAAEIGSLDPWWMRSVANGLERARIDLHDVGAELARMADAAIGGSAAARCALLAEITHERAAEAAALASGARSAGNRVDEVLGSVARRLNEVVDGPASQLDSSPWERSPWERSPWEPASSGSPWREPTTRELPWREPSWLTGPDPHPPDKGAGARSGGPFDGYAAVLRAVRAELSSAIEQLPTLVGLHPTDRGDHGGWTAEPGRGTWMPEPGYGAQLPGTEARRVETDVGVRIARLPDGPRG
jgi:hypothetical protein